MIFAALAQILPWRRRPRLIDRLAQPLDDLGQVLFEAASDGVLTLDGDGRIIRANATLRRMLGETADLAPGRPAVALFAREERQMVAEAIATALDGTRPPRRFVSRFDQPPASAGSERDAAVDVAATPLREADGAISGVVLRLSDVTALKSLEAQLAHGQKLAAVGQLAGGIAHDFNNLLTAVIGAADLVLAREALDETTVADVGQIRRSAERGAALVRQLLAFSRQQTLKPRVVAVNEAICDLSDLLRRLLGAKVKLVLDLETPGRSVRVDPSQLDQVLINLAVNARDAMPEGGTLTLRSGRLTLFRPLTRGEEVIPPGRYVMIEVADTGSGIPKEVLGRIFDPFFTTKRERGGTGLGLSMVHGIVRQSEGFLAVESEPGKGTLMRLYLPRCDAPVTAPAREPAAVARAGPPEQASLPLADPAPALGDAAAGRRVVLVVDDEEPVLRLATRFLTQRGWTVLAAESGDAALALMEQAGNVRLAAMVTDVVMPGLDGPALVRRMRDRQPGLPSILASGYAEEAIRRDLAEEDTLFLAKPYTLKELAGMLEKATSREPAPVH